MDKYLPSMHLLIDFWGAKHMRDMCAIEEAFRLAIVAGGATLKGMHLHEFGEGAGVTGVAVLAESHISIHTWPELDYMALDIFMCGSANIEAALQSLQQSFCPVRMQVKRCPRGGKPTIEMKE